MSRRPFNAIVEMARFSGTSTGWRLVVSDRDSSSAIVEVTLTDEAVGKMLGHLHDGTSLPGLLYDVSRVGMTMETKTVRMPIVSEFRDVETIYSRAEEENPGWKADRDERWNTHRVSRGTYSVHLRRWAAKDGAR